MKRKLYTFELVFFALSFGVATYVFQNYTGNYKVGATGASIGSLAGLISTLVQSVYEMRKG